VETDHGDDCALGFERVVFFSDAVFAIAITLLVLPLTAEIDLSGGGSLGSQVADLWPSVLTFVVSFPVVGQFWIAHHRTFGQLRRVDPTVIWLNLILLLTVAFMPFPAALLRARDTSKDALAVVLFVVLFAASMTVTSLVLTGTWLYAVRPGLTAPERPPGDLRRTTLRTVATTVVFAFSIGAGFLGPAVTCWLGILPAARLPVVRRRSEPAAAH
jgi:uncharacterized membrane protein